MTAAAPPSRWAGTGPDVAAFAIGLGLAWWFNWNTTDLVWSLWLSSLVVGYALILWIQSAPLREVVGNIAADRSGVAGPGPKALVILGAALVTLFGVAFFTVHFGGFHFGHSVFLGIFFPVSADGPKTMASWAMYQEVLTRYWWFLPAAFLAEREGFRRVMQKPDTSVTADAIAKRKAAGDQMMAPYRNVIRMHLLIFFFFGAKAAGLENFAVYAVVYAAYFFPWRVLKRERPALAAA